MAKAVHARNFSLRSAEWQPRTAFSPRTREGSTARTERLYQDARRVPPGWGKFKMTRDDGIVCDHITSVSNCLSCMFLPPSGGVDRVSAMQFPDWTSDARMLRFSRQ